MREIKFKAKKANSNEWIFGMPTHDLKYMFNETQMDSPDNYEIIPESVCQFTGLQDKNGVDIYEGDQLHICAGYSSTVEFQDGMFVSVYEHPEDGETIPLLDAIGKYTVVVGNIHD